MTIIAITIVDIGNDIDSGVAGLTDGVISKIIHRVVTCYQTCMTFLAILVSLSFPGTYHPFNQGWSNFAAVVAVAWAASVAWIVQSINGIIISYGMADCTVKSQTGFDTMIMGHS